MESRVRNLKKMILLPNLRAGKFPTEIKADRFQPQKKYCQREKFIRNNPPPVENHGVCPDGVL